MPHRLTWVGIVLIAGIAVIGGAGAVANPGSSIQIVTIGSTSGTPTTNICAAMADCTYVPFSDASTPGLRVPFDGTVTSFSINSGTCGVKVRLRVLRPAGEGRYLGAGTSDTQTLSIGPNSLSVSLPVKAGDVLGLEDASSALLFDTSAPTAVTAYYQSPALADGTIATPNHSQSGERLLLSAVVQSSLPTTASSPPTVSDARQSNPAWRRGSKLATISRLRRRPIGTTFSFVLNRPARIRFAFIQQRAGPRINGMAALAFAGHAGKNRIFFDGRISPSKTLVPGRYALVITATDAAGRRSQPRSLSFTIVG
jgi:hypothetical protein